MNSLVSFLTNLRQDRLQRGIHSSGSEFLLNRIAKATKSLGKPNILYMHFCEPRQCADNANPFKVRCQDLVNR